MLMMKGHTAQDAAGEASVSEDIDVEHEQGAVLASRCDLLHGLCSIDRQTLCSTIQSDDAASLVSD